MTGYCIIFTFLAVAIAKLHPEAKLHFVEYCQYFKYPVQSHEIQTEDGYLMTFFRIQAKNTIITNGLKVVYLQHGLLDSSDTWIINDEDKAPAFILANRGYDVWLGIIILPHCREQPRQHTFQETHQVASLVCQVLGFHYGGLRHL